MPKSRNHSKEEKKRARKNQRNKIRLIKKANKVFGIPLPEENQ